MKAAGWPARGTGPAVLHPYLLAAWPVLLLLAANAGEARASDAMAALLVIVAGATALVALLTVLLRDVRRAGLVTSVLAVTLLTYGHVGNLTGEPPWLLPAWLGAATAAVVAAVRTGTRLDGATRVANRLGGALVALSLISIASVAISGQLSAADAGDGGAGSAGTASEIEPTPAQSLSWRAGGPPRDVYYVVFDRYGSAASLEALFGLDNQPFMDELTDRGFTVLPDARANHLRTAQSLASSLRMDYLLDLRAEHGPNTGDLGPVHALLQDHRVGRLFQSAGYRYVHVGSWWDPTATNTLADEVLGYEGPDNRGGGSDFTEVLLDTSLLGALPEDAAVGPNLRLQHREAAMVQLDQLPRVAQDPRPTFTFAHVLLPHEPYVFDAEGRPVTSAEAKARTLQENFAGQLAYTNDRIAGLVEELLAGPDEQDPIILLQADEGPHPPRSNQPGSGFTWPGATDEELVGKLGILSAWYVPEGLHVPVSQAETPVNSFRVLFNALYGGTFEVLPERSYIFRDTAHLYDFTDVTERLGTG